MKSLRFKFTSLSHLGNPSSDPFKNSSIGVLRRIQEERAITDRNTIVALFWGTVIVSGSIAVISLIKSSSPSIVFSRIIEVTNFRSAEPKSSPPKPQNSLPRRVPPNQVNSSHIRPVDQPVVIDRPRIQEPSKQIDPTSSIGNNSNSNSHSEHPDRASDPPNGLVTTEVQVPSEDDVPTVEMEPQIDWDLLMRTVQYPENARRMMIEGTVVVNVLVSMTGEPMRTRIIQSDNSMLDASAISAINNCRFTPAVQNGVNVACWLSIPIRYRLH